MKSPMTLRGAELLRQELQQLKNIERPKISQAIAEARSHGDLSENAEYDAARDKQGLMEARIRDIESKLGNAQVVDPKTLQAEGRVVFGATVEVEEESGDAATWQIVGEDEADIKEGQTPGGLKRYEIVDVRYQ